VLLAIGAIFAGMLNNNEALGHFLGKSPSLAGAAHVLQAQHDVENAGAQAMHLAAGFGQAAHPSAHAEEEAKVAHLRVMIISALIALAGIGLAYFLHLHNRKAGDAVVARHPLLAKVLEQKYYVDEIYYAAIVNPLWLLGQAFFWMDQKIVDGLVWLIGFIPQASGFGLKLSTQRGQLQGYALTMLLGVLLVLWIVLSV
jgi:NADH-quinone oxidoreductase subunit L